MTVKPKHHESDFVRNDGSYETGYHANRLLVLVTRSLSSGNIEFVAQICYEWQVNSAKPEQDVDRWCTTYRSALNKTVCWGSLRPQETSTCWVEQTASGSWVMPWLSVVQHTCWPWQQRGERIQWVLDRRSGKRARPVGSTRPSLQVPWRKWGSVAARNSRTRNDREVVCRSSHCLLGPNF